MDNPITNGIKNGMIYLTTIIIIKIIAKKYAMEINVCFLFSNFVGSNGIPPRNLGSNNQNVFYLHYIYKVSKIIPHIELTKK